MIRLTIWGNPIPKARPRAVSQGGFTRVYSPKKNTDYENEVRKTYQELHCATRYNEDEPLIVDLYCYLAIPKSFSNKKRGKAYLGEIFPLGKPDIDNIAKSVLDGLQDRKNRKTGIVDKGAFADDKQVVKLSVHKLYDDDPRVEIVISKPSERYIDHNEGGIIW